MKLELKSNVKSTDIRHKDWRSLFICRQSLPYGSHGESNLMRTCHHKRTNSYSYVIDEDSYDYDEDGIQQSDNYVDEHRRQI